MVLEDLGSRVRGVIVSHHSWATSILAAQASYNIIENERRQPAISEASPIHRPTIESFLDKRKINEKLYPVYVSFPPPENIENPLIIHSVGFNLGNYHSLLRRLLYNIRVVFVDANRGLGTILRFPVYRLVWARGKVFKVYRGSKLIEVVEVTGEGIDKASLSSSRTLRLAYEALLEAMANYGELRVKDAVYVIMASVGVDSRRARSVLGELINEGKVVVKKGVVMLK